MSQNNDVYNLVNTGDSTGWLDCQSTVADFGFHAIVSGTVTYVLEISMDPTTAKVDAYTVQSFSVSQATQLEYPIPRFIRFRKTAGSGSVLVAIWPGRTADNQKVFLRPQSSANSPSSDFQ